MKEKILSFFKIKERGSSIGIELVAGLTTFMTMAYVLVTQPAAMTGGAAQIVDVNGVVITSQSIMILTALISGLVTVLMALYTNLPFALSAAMGTNFMLGTCLQKGEISFAQMMTIILVSGLIFLAMSIFGIRDLIVRMIPKNIKVSISACIGFFIAMLGLKNSGICDFSNGLNPGDFTKPAVFLSVIGLFIIAILTAKNVKGALLIGIVVTTALGIPMGITPMPTSIFSLPDFTEMKGLLFKFDFKGLLTPQFFILMFTAFFSDFFCTLGTVLGVAGKADMLDENGDFPEIQKPFLVDAIGTVAGACFGTTTVTTYVESTAGVEAGGRTGLTSLTTAVLLIATIFIAPLFSIIPAAATAPALIFVGFTMIQGIKNIDFSNFAESFGPFMMILIGAFSGSIADGIAAGILCHVVMTVFIGKFKELHVGMYALCLPLVVYFII
ncbi:MAG: NCS2 family permease [bacterium]|nr:NCS2 family permease [bacterium]